MGMSDCIKCWETPCVCGHDYQNWSIESLQKQIKMLQGVLTKKGAKTFQRTNWSNEQILKFLDGQKIVNGEGIVDNYCQDHNDTIDDIKDFFYDFMRPETEFGATGYCVEEDTVYHIGGLPEPLKVQVESKCAIPHTKENEKTFRGPWSEGGFYCKVCGEDWP